MVVHATSVTATGRMLAVLAHTTVTGRHVTALLSVLVESSRLFGEEETMRKSDMEKRQQE